MKRSLSLNFIVGSFLIGGLMAIAALSLVWTPYDPMKLQLGMRLQPPSSAHWFGTDDIGRDVLSRLMTASFTSVTIALCTVLAATVSGSIVGVISGYARGWIDPVLMIFNNALLAFPGILLAPKSARIQMSPPAHSVPMGPLDAPGAPGLPKPPLPLVQLLKFWEPTSCQPGAGGLVT